MKKAASPKVTYQTKPPASVTWGLHDSPAGRLVIGVTPNGVVCRVSFAPGSNALATLEQWQREWPKTVFTKDEKKTAAAAKIIAKAALPELLMTGSPFQLSVWKNLLEVPAGKTISYGGLAKRIKNPKAARAVGNACGKNPVAFLVPCHRVIANDGGLGGFGSSLAIKRMLLESEGATPKKK